MDLQMKARPVVMIVCKGHCQLKEHKQTWNILSPFVEGNSYVYHNFKNAQKIMLHFPIIFKTAIFSL